MHRLGVCPLGHSGSDVEPFLLPLRWFCKRCKKYFK